MKTFVRPDACSTCMGELFYPAVYNGSLPTAMCRNHGCRFYGREFVWPELDVRQIQAAALLRERLA